MINSFIVNAFVDEHKTLYGKMSPQQEHDMYAYAWSLSHDYVNMFYAAKAWHKNRYHGLEILKFPNDLWIYGEIIQEIRPDLIIETGTRNGSSALWFADQLNIIGKGKVVTVEIDNTWGEPEHPRITYIKGSSISDEVVAKVAKEAEGKAVVMVDLDSNHDTDHVLKEMIIYGPLVTEGSYMIVEDTILNHPVKVMAESGKLYIDGPWEAVDQYLKNHKGWDVDTSRERFQITTNPHGYLRRRKIEHE